MKLWRISSARYNIEHYLFHSIPFKILSIDKNETIYDFFQRPPRNSKAYYIPRKIFLQGGPDRIYDEVDLLTKKSQFSILTGHYGCGKTTTQLFIFQSCLKSSYIPIWMKLSVLDTQNLTEDSIWQCIHDTLHISRYEIREFINLQSIPIFLFFDLDEVSDVNISLIEKIALFRNNTPNLTIIAAYSSCQDIPQQFFQNSNIFVYEFCPLTKDEAVGYYQTVKVTFPERPCPLLDFSQKGLNSPLLLYCLTMVDIEKVTLGLIYWRVLGKLLYHRCKNISVPLTRTKISQELGKLACKMQSNCCIGISHGDANKIVSKGYMKILNSSGFLQSGEVCRFIHDSFISFLAGIHLIINWENIAEEEWDNIPVTFTQDFIKKMIEKVETAPVVWMDSIVMICGLLPNKYLRAFLQQLSLNSPGQTEIVSNIATEFPDIVLNRVLNILQEKRLAVQEHQWELLIDILEKHPDLLLQEEESLEKIRRISFPKLQKSNPGLAQRLYNLIAIEKKQGLDISIQETDDTQEDDPKYSVTTDDYQLEELQRHQNLIRRFWFHDQVEAFTKNGTGGYLLLEAPPGFGKSALIADCVRHDDQAIYHFIKYGMGDWDSPYKMLDSVVAQLCHKYSLPQLDGNKSNAKLVEILKRVSCKLSVGKNCIIYVDGLDEAFGPNGRFSQIALSDIFPRYLPPRVVFLLTSRPGEFLSYFSDQDICERITWKKQGIDAEIDAYFTNENERRHLNIDLQFRKILVQKSEGLFVASSRFLTGKDDVVYARLKIWKVNPDLIPEGLTGWLQSQWKNLSGKCFREEIKILLGLLATARQPLSYDDIDEFLCYLHGHSQPLSSFFIRLKALHDNLEYVLLQVEEFFDPIDMNHPKATPYRFFHSSFPEFILERMTRHEYRSCHLAFALAGANWDGMEDTAREYAICHRQYHLLEAREWEQYATTFAELEFTAELIQRRDGLHSVVAELQKILTNSKLPEKWCLSLNQWKHFLRRRIPYLPVFPSAYIQEVINEFLPEASKIMAKILQPLQDVWSNSQKLHKIAGPSTLQDIGHLGRINYIAFSGDGQKIASAGDDCTIKIWDANNGNLIADCKGHIRAVLNVAFSGDGSRIVSASYDGTVKIWDANNGSLITNCKESSELWRVAFSGDGQKIASASGYGMLKIWNANNGSLIADFKGHIDWSSSVAFSSDSSKIVSASGDGIVKIWDANNGNLIADCRGHIDTVRSLAFSDDDRLVASASDDGTVKIWDANNGNLITDCKMYKNGVRSVFFSDDGIQIASVNNDNTVKIWDTNNGNLIADYKGYHEELMTVIFSDDGIRTASISNDGTIKIWNVTNGNLIANCKGLYSARILAISSDGMRIASVSDNDTDTVKIWDVINGNLIADCKGLYSARILAISSDGMRIASTIPINSSDDEGTMKIWDANNGNLIADCKGTGLVERAAFSNDANRIASGNTFGSLKIWDTNNGNLITDCQGCGINSVFFSGDGNRIAASYCDTVKIWNANNGDLIIDYTGHRKWDRARRMNSVNCAVFSSDGSQIASASNDSIVKIWDANNGNLIADCKGHLAWHITFSCDGRWLASASWDGTVKIWNANDGKCVNTLFFYPPALGLAFHTGPPLLLIVCNQIGHVFQYQFTSIDH